jgi:hypothetical protein
MDRMPFVIAEADTQRVILQYLGYRHFCWRNNTGGRPWTDNKGKKRLFRFGKVGSGDIQGIQRQTGIFFSIEVKRRGKKPSPEQVEFMRRVNESGAIAFIAYSLEDVIAKGL